MKIVVGSENPAKIAAVQDGFSAMFSNESIEIRGINVESGVPSQPIGREETIIGATNRAKRVLEKMSDIDFAVGVEAGIEEIGGKIGAFAWMVVISKEGVVGKGEAGVFFLPESISKLIRSGVELGIAADRVFDVKNSKHSTGTVGILTKNALNRPEYYRQAVILALMPHVNQNMLF